MSSAGAETLRAWLAQQVQKKLNTISNGEIENSNNRMIYLSGTDGTDRGDKGEGEEEKRFNVLSRWQRGQAIAKVFGGGAKKKVG